MVEQIANVSRQRLASFCQKNHIQRLAVFGSALRDDFRPQSDLDLLVEFDPGKVPGLAFFSMQDELSAIFSRVVDLNTPNCLSPEFRDRVIAEAEVLYVAS